MTNSSGLQTESKTLKQAKQRMKDAEEQEFYASLPPDRFGVNPVGLRPIQPKGPRKGSKKKAPGF